MGRDESQAKAPFSDANSIAGLIHCLPLALVPASVASSYHSLALAVWSRKLGSIITCRSSILETKALLSLVMAHSVLDAIQGIPKPPSLMGSAEIFLLR